MDLGSTVEAFFQDEVERAFRDEGLSPGVRVEHYVVQLLAGYAVQQIESTPLALVRVPCPSLSPPFQMADAVRSMTGPPY